jgi:hypothetical protein
MDKIKSMKKYMFTMHVAVSLSKVTGEARAI